MTKLKERSKPLPGVHEFSGNIKGTHVGLSGSGSHKNNMQLDLFTDRATSFPVDEVLEAGTVGNAHSTAKRSGGMQESTTASPSNGKIHFDATDLQRQLSELCEGNHIKVKTNPHQDIAVNIRSTDKGDTVTINPKRWRGTKKTEHLTDFIMRAVANNYG